MALEYEQSFLDDIKARVPLASLIGSRVLLAKQGADTKGLCPFHSEKTPSFTVYPDHYHCYGCGATGDHYTWLDKIEGLKFKEAVERLSKMAGTQAPASAKAPAPTIGHPPHDAAPPDARVNGEKPSLLSPYRSAEGHILFYIARHETPKGKAVRPWAWNTSEGKWVSAGYPFPRPVLGLPQILADKKKPVLIVEGEKTREAATRIAGRVYHVTTWAGGALAITKTEWTPLFGRDVLLWPDADRQVIKSEGDAKKLGLPLGALLPYGEQPGVKAMQQIAALLAPHGGTIKLIDVGIDQERPDGWDAADADADGMDWPGFVAWAKPRTKPWSGAEIVNLGRERREREKPDAPKPPLTLQAKWDEVGLQLNSNGHPIANLDNALRVLERWPDFRSAVWYDEFQDRFYTSWNGKLREWSDADTLTLTTFLQRDMGIRNLKKTDAGDAMAVLGKRASVHGPRQWMDSLLWDGLERVAHFFSDAFGAESNNYINAASKNFWIGMVARIYRPGCKMDNMIVLEGTQGALKSTALAAIGGDWFTESGTAITDKDFFQQLPGKMLVEIAELDAFSKADQRRIKSVLSRPVDRYRPSYGRFARDYPRQCVFAGTTNEDHYLEDTTGGRRFWPIRCGAINLQMIRENREQLFAEAVERFKRGENWWEMPLELTRVEQEARRERDAWEGIVGRHLGQLYAATTTMESVAKESIQIAPDRLDKPTQRRLAQAMRLAGWVPLENGQWVPRGQEDTE